MKRSKWLFLSAVFLVPAPSMRAQSNDWNSVEKLSPGTSISVVKRGRLGCELIRVSDAELDCMWQHEDVTRRYVFARDEVREIRLEEPEHNKMIAGIIVGAAIGAAIGFVAGGQSSDPESRAYARIYGAPIGASAGGLIGHAIHRHGAVIYRRP